VLAKLKAIWRDDALAGRLRTRIVIFANTRTRAGEMGAYLSEHRVPNIVVTGQSINCQGNVRGARGQRIYGSNKHLAGFLKPMPNKKSPTNSQSPSERGEEKTEIVGAGAEEAGGKLPHVLLSTSLLARGLDFDPSISHVFVLDPPRNTADFLHRAGRTARAGGRGRVVVFGKGGGRGAGKLREMRQQLAALATLAR
jgi:ATP-dependent RNA helicase MRH4, mitochondrial